MKVVELAGQRFGRLLVTSRNFGPASSTTGKAYWNCLCDCGSTPVVSRGSLYKGTSSCGCIRTDAGKLSKGWEGVGDISKSYLGALRAKALQRNILFDITLEQIWQLFLEQHRTCVLSGIPIKMQSRANASDGNASLDRIDSSKGYIVGNVQWVHKDINRMKSNFSEESFVEMCCKIADHTRQQKSCLSS